MGPACLPNLERQAIENWLAWEESNRQPPSYQDGALTVELQANKNLVVPVGLEPTSLCVRSAAIYPINLRDHMLMRLQLNLWWV